MLKVMDKAHTNRIKVADYLNDLDPADFDMQRCSDCICGHINRAFMASYSHHWDVMKEAAAKFLGINEFEATQLFCPPEVINDKDCDPDPRDAARVVRYLAATDTVDWSVGLRESYTPVSQGIGFDMLEETLVA